MLEDEESGWVSEIGSRIKPDRTVSAAKIRKVYWNDARKSVRKLERKKAGKTLIPDPAVSAIVHIPWPHANALVRSSGEAFSARSAVHAGVQTAALKPPANPTPPIALANKSMFRSRVNAKRTCASVAERKPQNTNCFLPYLSAARANGTRLIVFAIAETELTAPMTSPEKPISLRYIGNTTSVYPSGSEFNPIAASRSLRSLAISEPWFRKVSLTSSRTKL